MPVRITCPHCHQELRLPDELYYRPAQCPFCEGAFALHWRRRSGPTAKAPAEGGERRFACRFCGEPTSPSATKCSACGESLEI
jgi:hypothetical protein